MAAGAGHNGTCGAFAHIGKGPAASGRERADNAGE